METKRSLPVHKSTTVLLWTPEGTKRHLRELREAKSGIGYAAPEDSNAFRKAVEAVNATVSVIDVADLVCGPMKLRPLDENRWVGPCPLLRHDSKDLPAFVVFKDENRWHCFGCGKGGSSALELYALAGGYTDEAKALKDLAHEYGVSTGTWAAKT